jgi:hypothetical protein
MLAHATLTRFCQRSYAHMYHTGGWDLGSLRESAITSTRLAFLGITGGRSTYWPGTSYFFAGRGKRRSRGVAATLQGGVGMRRSRRVRRGQSVKDKKGGRRNLSLFLSAERPRLSVVRRMVRETRPTRVPHGLKPSYISASPLRTSATSAVKDRVRSSLCGSVPGGDRIPWVSEDRCAEHPLRTGPTRPGSPAASGARRARGGR